jgi:hypothetical protein
MMALAAVTSGRKTYAYTVKIKLTPKAPLNTVQALLAAGARIPVKNAAAGFSIDTSSTNTASDPINSETILSPFNTPPPPPPTPAPATFTPQLESNLNEFGGLYLTGGFTGSDPTVESTLNIYGNTQLTTEGDANFKDVFDTYNIDTIAVNSTVNTTSCSPTDCKPAFNASDNTIDLKLNLGNGDQIYAVEIIKITEKDCEACLAKVIITVTLTFILGCAIIGALTWAIQKKRTAKVLQSLLIRKER